MTPIETTEAFFRAYNAHDTQAMLAHAAADGTFEYVPYGEQGKGPLSYAPQVWQMFIDAFPDFRVDVKALHETKNGAVVAETVNGGTQAKEVYGIANKGRAQHVPHVFVITFNGEGKIQHLKAYWDNNSIYAQLGHTETHE